MNTTILQTLFFDNPELSSELTRFCNSVPEYVQAEQDFDRAARELQDLVGYERYSRFEDILNHHLDMENRVCYLFGLNLRRELRQALGL